MKFSELEFNKNKQRIFLYSFIFVFLFQMAFWFWAEKFKPNVHIVPPLPSKYSVEALSFGDKEFYFRILGMKIQNAGDSFGRVTPLKNYDYSKLYKWFKILDSLNDRSIFVPMMASYYFSQTQNKKDTIYIVKYLDEYSSKDIDKNWWWIFQATYIAQATLKDYDLALKLAYKLSKNNASEAPLWTKQLPAFLHEKLGEDCEAFKIIDQILNENELGIRPLKQEEMNFMRFFIKNRLQKLTDQNFNPAKCKN